MLVATIVSCAWTLVAAQDAAAGVAVDAKLVQKITAEAESTIRTGPVAGVAVGVLRAGATLFCGGFGFAEDYDIERKFRETRLYQVAPISTNLILSHVATHVLDLPKSF